MQRIDEKTVELSKEEQEASRIFEAFLDAGLGIYTAVAAVEKFYRKGAHTGNGTIILSREFIEYLRGN